MAEHDIEENMPPAMPAKLSRNIEPGDHRGMLTRINYAQRGDQKFPYLDVFVTPIDPESGEPMDIELKIGYAANNVTSGSAIGQLLTRFGFDVAGAAKAGRDVDWSVLAKGTPVVFTTVTEETANGKFARILQETLRPANAPTAAKGGRAAPARR